MVSQSFYFILGKQKAMVKRSYEAMVPFYDALVKLVYRNALRNAQVCFLCCIAPRSRILIVGGGTGWILEDIARIHTDGLWIDYIDGSAKMIAEAKRRNAGNNTVQFIHQSLFYWQPVGVYDVIITPFFFDNFKEENAHVLFLLLHSSLQKSGLWLYTDFQIAHKNAYWQKAMLFMMYSFFRTLAGIEAKRLPPVTALFAQYHYNLVKSNLFFHRFIVTSVYKKQ